MTRKLGWFDILRLGLVQAAIGSLVVITTSTLNRVLVVELALPAILPGVLVALHYFVQVVRPRFGYDSDLGGRRTPWIIGGIATLAAGGVGAVLATCLMPINLALGIALAVLAFIVIGLGVGVGYRFAGVDVQAHRAAASRRGGDRDLVDDDRRLHRHERHRRAHARAVFAHASGGDHGRHRSRRFARHGTCGLRH
jgi:MFS family permease